MPPTPSTFSIVAADPESREVGVAVQSKFLAVGAVVSYARGDIGAVACQASLDCLHGPRSLHLISSAGLEPESALNNILKDDTNRDSRQIGIVDAIGRSASFTGQDCFEHADSMTGAGFACQGNILASSEVVPAMAQGFESARGPLPERMIEALRAGQRAGGDRRGQESAHLLIMKPGHGYGGNHDRYIDLRVDHHSAPIEAMARLLELHRLYFERPKKSDLLPVDAALEDKIGSLLKRASKWIEGKGTMEILEDFMGWQNLEERFVGPDNIDPKVIKYLENYVKNI